MLTRKLISLATHTLIIQENVGVVIEHVYGDPL